MVSEYIQLNWLKKSLLQREQIFAGVKHELLVNEI